MRPFCRVRFLSWYLFRRMGRAGGAHLRQQKKGNLGEERKIGCCETHFPQPFLNRINSYVRKLQYNGPIQIYKLVSSVFIFPYWLERVSHFEERPCWHGIPRDVHFYNCHLPDVKKTPIFYLLNEKTVDRTFFPIWRSLSSSGSRRHRRRSRDLWNHKRYWKSRLIYVPNYYFGYRKILETIETNFDWNWYEI